MALEPGVVYIEDLVDTNPVVGDNVSEGDDHIRNIKTAVQGSFPSLGAAAVTKTAAEINDLVEQTDPVLNGTITGTAFLDDDAFAADSAIAVASQQSIKAYVDTKIASLNTKIVEIGDWDMTGAGITKTVAHDLTLSKIRSINVTIRNDADDDYDDFPSAYATGASGWSKALWADGTNINIFMQNNGRFDTTDYNATTYNRGWIVIQYTD